MGRGKSFCKCFFVCAVEPGFLLKQINSTRFLVKFQTFILLFPFMVKIPKMHFIFNDHKIFVYDNVST